MKITIVSPYSFSNYGGVNAQIVLLAREFLEQGHEVHVDGLADSKEVLNNQFSDVSKQHLESGKFMLNYLGKAIRVPSNGSDANIGIRPLSLIKTLIQKFDADIIHLHEPFVPGPTLMYLLRPKTVPIVATFHRNGVDLLYKNYMKIAKMFSSKIDASVAVSESAKDTIELVSNLRPPILFNGINLEEFRTDTQPKDDDSINILFVGRFEPRKGYDIFLKAMDIINTQNHLKNILNIKFTIVGSGNDFIYHSKRYAEINNVNFMSELTRDKLVEQYLKADIFVAPATSSESFGLVLLEAMAANTALIVSDITPFRAVLKETGLYFKVGDAEDLSKQLTELISDRAKIRLLKKVARERVTRYSIDVLAAKYIEMFEDLLKKRS